MVGPRRATARGGQGAPRAGREHRSRPLDARAARGTRVHGMIFGESRAKDLYRRAVWGPAATAMDAIPAPWEAAIVRVGGRVAAEVVRTKRDRIRRNMVRAFGDRREIDRWSGEAFAAHASNQYAPLSFRKCTTETWRRYLAF